MRRTNIAHKIYNYAAIFEPAKEGGYNVSFPDFSGCVTFGRNFEEAKEKAREVLALWIEEMFARRKRIPARSARPLVDEVEVSLRASAK